MRVAVCPGSFDPITKGHVDVVARAAGLFDEIIVAVLCNYEKTPTFSTDERVDFAKKALARFENVRVEAYDGLLVNYAKDVGACAIIKGLRAVTDFEYEFQMSLINKKMNPEVETLFLNTNSDYMYLSSSLVKQIAAFGGDITDFIPEEITEDIQRRLIRRTK